MGGGKKGKSRGIGTITIKKQVQVLKRKLKKIHAFAGMAGNGDGS